MMLNDKKIKEFIRSGRIVVDPYDEKLVGSASLDVRLGFRFRIFKWRNIEVLDIKNFRDEFIEKIDKEDEIIYEYRYTELIELKTKEKPFIIHPGEFVLASIYEYIKLPNDIAGVIQGRSSLARLGLIIHTSAGWIDPGYEGHITLEIVNVNNVPIKLYPLTRIAQIQFFKIDPAEKPYSGKYLGDLGATGSKIIEDFEE